MTVRYGFFVAISGAIVGLCLMAWRLSVATEALDRLPNAAGQAVTGPVARAEAALDATAAGLDRGQRLRRPERNARRPHGGDAAPARSELRRLRRPRVDGAGKRMLLDRRGRRDRPCSRLDHRLRASRPLLIRAALGAGPGRYTGNAGAGSSNGRTPDSGSGSQGSNPCPAASRKPCKQGFCVSRVGAATAWG